MNETEPTTEIKTKTAPKQRHKYRVVRVTENDEGELRCSNGVFGRREDADKQAEKVRQYHGKDAVVEVEEVDETV